MNPIPTVTNWGEAVLVSITAALMALLSFLPALIGAVILVIIGWWLGSVLGRVVEGLLNRVGFEHAMERTGVTGFISRTGAGTMRTSHLIGEIAKWFVRLIFLELAAQALHLTAVTTLLNSIVLWIPNLVVALIIVLLGFVLAQFVGRVLRGALSRSGMGNADILATIAEYGIIGLAVVTALNQIGVATTIITILFGGIVLALALAAGLAFGLGGRETAAEIWSQSYEGTRKAARQMGDGSGNGGGYGGGSGNGGARVQRPVETGYRSQAMSGPGWRTLVSVKLREARQAVPDGPDGQRVARLLDDVMARIERPSVAQSDYSQQPRL